MNQFKPSLPLAGEKMSHIHTIEFWNKWQEADYFPLNLAVELVIGINPDDKVRFEKKGVQANYDKLKTLALNYAMTTPKVAFIPKSCSYKWKSDPIVFLPEFGAWAQSIGYILPKYFPEVPLDAKDLQLRLDIDIATPIMPTNNNFKELEAIDLALEEMKIKNITDKAKERIKRGEDKYLEEDREFARVCDEIKAGVNKDHKDYEYFCELLTMFSIADKESNQIMQLLEFGTYSDFIKMQDISATTLLAVCQKTNKSSQKNAKRLIQQAISSKGGIATKEAIQRDLQDRNSRIAKEAKRLLELGKEKKDLSGILAKQFSLSERQIRTILKTAEI